MKFRLPNKFNQNIGFITKKCGYFQISDRKTGKDSFVRKLTADHYPRFHLYTSESEQEVVFDLHLDQSKTRYEGQKAHRADYESEEVKAELTRIYQTVSQFQI
ncbi:MAG: hypothetical protein U9O20_03690 [Patescibacteria group bacterium]|nr:hypothetical protein [Patescibacteria group bacterium]